MANTDNLKDTIQQIRTAAQHLSQDLDQQHPREETADDLDQLSLSFQDLKDIFFALKQEDKANLQHEVQELFSGKEDFKTYTRDVNKILMDVKNRIQADKKVADKVTQNLPEEHQNENPNNLIQGFSQLMNQVSDWLTKTGSR